MQIAIGDQHGLVDLEYQPAKIAAVEGHWENKPGESLPLILFGWPDMAAETTRYVVQVPHLGGVVLTHSWTDQIRGLKDFAPEDRPNSTIVFWTFRIMVGLGFLMLLLGLWGAWARWHNQLYQSKIFLRFAVLMGPAGLIAIVAGWLTTEIGRQPWGWCMASCGRRMRYPNTLRSSFRLRSSCLSSCMCRLWYRHQIHAGAGGEGPQPQGDHPPEPEGQSGRPACPLSAVPDRIDPAGTRR